MKKYIGLIFAFIFISQSCLSDTIEVDFKVLDRNINFYMADYVNKINKKKEAEIFGYSPEGGMIIADFDEENNILFFKSYLFFETGKIKYECYFVEDNVKYFLKTTYRYNLPVSDVNSESTSKEIEKMIILDNRIYLLNAETNQYNLFKNDRYIPLITEFLEAVR